MSQRGFAPILVIIAILIAVGTGAYYLGRQSRGTQAPVITDIARQPTPTPYAATADTETVTGLICYPSENVPPGRLEAKNVETGEITYQDYPGSFKLGNNSYSLSLRPGNYYVRFVIPSSEGDGVSYTAYNAHKDVPCPDGRWAGCNVKSLDPTVAKVGNGKTVADFHLCDGFFVGEEHPSF